jgi:GTPase SAR1 family protein
MESFNIAVIGATGVGKSSFVQRVLGLQRPSMSNTSSVRMTVDNLTHFVTLLELDLEYFELSPSQPIQWPKQMNGHIVPRVDAALILYDVLDKESIRDLPQTVGTFSSSVPVRYTRWLETDCFSCFDELGTACYPRGVQMRAS